MPQLPVHRLVNNLGVNLPQISKRTFLLEGRKWELPSWENAETFVERLVKRGELVVRGEKRGAYYERAGAGVTDELASGTES